MTVSALQSYISMLPYLSKEPTKKVNFSVHRIILYSYDAKKERFSASDLNFVHC